MRWLRWRLRRRKRLRYPNGIPRVSTPTGGTFTLSFDNGSGVATTAPIPHDADAPYIALIVSFMDWRQKLQDCYKLSAAASEEEYYRMIVWCRECGTAPVNVHSEEIERPMCVPCYNEEYPPLCTALELKEMINRPIDYDVLRPRAFIDMTLAQQESIIPERCAGYFSAEAIAERWPQHSTVYTAGKTSTLDEYLGGYEALWASRAPRVEWNTVDLKDLREYRQTFYEYRRWRWEELGF